MTHTIEQREINTDLLLSTLAHIEAHPEDWNQSKWATSCLDYLPKGNICGTAYCFAGHVVMQAGREIDFLGHHGAEFGVLGTRSEFDADGQVGNEPNGNLSIAQFARRELGLALNQANVLFAANNTLQDLRNIVDELCTSGTVPAAVRAGRGYFS